jgi:hypothetical protein
MPGMKGEVFNKWNEDGGGKEGRGGGGGNQDIEKEHIRNTLGTQEEETTTERQKLGRGLIVNVMKIALYSDLREKKRERERV